MLTPATCDKQGAETQNRHIGDVADFGKYGLLRYLSGETPEDDGCRLRLGVVGIWTTMRDTTGA